ncbi:MAG TPA: glycosyltransferase, partial [Thiobacillus sp.]|nr:glycosyltransferase [Thiobacillus sp.]
MAAALPVVALDAPGAREVVRDRHNGRLLHEATPAAFSAALQWVAALPSESLRDLKQAARDTAEVFSMPRSADKALACYEALKPRDVAESSGDDSAWEEVMTAIRTEWDILKSVAGAGDAALGARLFSERED